MRQIQQIYVIFCIYCTKTIFTFITIHKFNYNHDHYSFDLLLRSDNSLLKFEICKFLKYQEINDNYYQKMASIDVSDFTVEDKSILLRMMWENMKPASFFAMSGINPLPYASKSALNAINSGYIDYFQGRCIKTDFRGNSINPFLYERDSTSGSVQKFVDKIRLSRK